MFGIQIEENESFRPHFTNEPFVPVSEQVTFDEAEHFCLSDVRYFRLIKPHQYQ